MMLGCVTFLNTHKKLSVAFDTILTQSETARQSRHVGRQRIDMQ